MRVFFLFLFSLLVGTAGMGATVAVHDPSVVVVYKDADGNSFPEQNESKSRTKFYYVMGTQLEAAYSKDLLNWTHFQPSFSVNGSETKDFLKVFAESAAWSNHYDNAKMKENLWAPDVIYNRALKKWCLYFSVNGDDWLSSIALLTSDRIEGPYEFKGTVVCSGMDNFSSGLGNIDYKKVTGSDRIASRYMKDGKWIGEYGSSCIDPSVLYDETGNLWMFYGSWSGGIFLIKLDENTGLRDYSHNFGYGNSSEIWDNKSLVYDPYMGLHIAGGYYVSGEGSYVEYIKDPDGKGYYYLFMSYGFYSPEGGYSMRVFRSETINGKYVDVTGDSSIFSKYIFNYGDNVQNGVAIMQNYKWSWWNIGQTAQGHNSLLQDEDGRCFLVYHTKYDNGTIHHNVEVHQLFFDEKGWAVAAPFEYREGDKLANKSYNTEELAGEYGVIVHRSVDYKNLECNTEETFYINADGSVSGAFSGSWKYKFADGRQFLSLETSAGTFDCVVMEQRMDDLSEKTLAFSGMNHQNELCLWGYKKPLTQKTVSTTYKGSSLIIGDPNTKKLNWQDYDKFHAIKVSGDFEIDYRFINHTDGAENWHNWAFAVNNGSETWHMRADVWNNSTFSGSTVNFKHSNPDFKSVFKEKEVVVKVRRVGSSYDIFAYAEQELIFTASAVNCAADEEVTVYLGGEDCYLDVKEVSVSALVSRNTVGTTNADGNYPAAFNVEKSENIDFIGDFDINFSFSNFRNADNKDVWDNYVVILNNGYIRSDAYSWDIEGDVTMNTSWGDDNESFLELMKNSLVDMNISKEGNTITITTEITDEKGGKHNFVAINTNALSDNTTIAFTCEESFLDFYKIETKRSEGSEATATANISTDSPFIFAIKDKIHIKSKQKGRAEIYDFSGKLVCTVKYCDGKTIIKGLKSGIYLINNQKYVVK